MVFDAGFWRVSAVGFTGHQDAAGSSPWGTSLWRRTIGCPPRTWLNPSATKRMGHIGNLWSWFVIVGTLSSLLVFLVFLFVNRKTSGEETSGHEWDGIQEFDNPLPFGGSFCLFFRWSLPLATSSGIRVSANLRALHGLDFGATVAGANHRPRTTVCTALCQAGDDDTCRTRWGSTGNAGRPATVYQPLLYLSRSYCPRKHRVSRSSR